MDGSDILTLANPSKVYLDSDTYTVLIDRGVYGSYWSFYEDIAYSCTTNTTGNYTLCEWVDSSGSFTKACLNVSFETSNSPTLVNSVCDSSSSDSLSYIYTNMSGIYHWLWYVDNSGTILISESGIFSSEYVGQEYTDFGLFFTILLVLSTGMAGIVAT